MASPTGEVIEAVATVLLDARALERLSPQTIDRLADLVAQRLLERRAAGEAPLLTTSDAARVAGVHPETLRRAIRNGALQTAGYVGSRPRLRRADVEAWIAESHHPRAAERPARLHHAPPTSHRTPASGSGVLTTALHNLRAIEGTRR